MKTIIFLLLSWLFVPEQVPSYATAEDYPIIIVIGGGSVNGDGPRGPVEVPIQGVVFGGSIVLSFSSNLGQVEVSVSEAAEGLIMSTVVDSSTLSAILPFSGDPGEYSITFSLSTGDEYDGSFVIE